jgi:predicted dehydrogenase
MAGAIPAGGFGSVASLGRMGYKSPNDKLNIAAIGAGGKGHSDIRGCATENIVAMADPDSVKAERMFKIYDKAPKYTDYRQMLDKEGRNIDAVLVSTPDHMHGAAAMAAMERGKHVYCQKPLTRTIWEARALAKAAKKYGVATQMGNQGYSNDGTRQCAEMVWAGDIGNVTEVHAWTNRPIWPQGVSELPAEEAVPSTMDWDSWLGVASDRPYSSAYAPFKWRGWFDFGCGALGDMACHILGAVNVALMLGAPTSVECLSQEGKNSLTYPTKSVIRFDFPARGAMPPVKIFWYDGMESSPKIEGVPEGEHLGDLPTPRRRREQPGEDPRARRPSPVRGGNVWPPKPVEQQDAEQAERAMQRASRNGSVFMGDKGILTTGTYGELTRLLPVKQMDDYIFPPELLTRSPGHYQDWIRAAKGGEPSCSEFSVAGPFTEWILLGVISLHFEGKLEWDSKKMKITNMPEANKYIKPAIRKGWSI